MPSQDHKITDQQRQQVEELIYSVFDKVDKTHTNSDYYRQIFSKMDNDQFYKFFQRRLPLRFHEDAFKIQPTMYDICDTFKNPYNQKSVWLYLLILSV